VTSSVTLAPRPAYIRGRTRCHTVQEHERSCRAAVQNLRHASGLSSSRCTLQLRAVSYCTAVPAPEERRVRDRTRHRTVRRSTTEPPPPPAGRRTAARGGMQYDTYSHADKGAPSWDETFTLNDCRCVVARACRRVIGNGKEHPACRYEMPVNTVLARRCAVRQIHGHFRASPVLPPWFCRSAAPGARRTAVPHGTAAGTIIQGAREGRVWPQAVVSVGLHHSPGHENYTRCLQYGQADLRLLQDTPQLLGAPSVLLHAPS
jgi:hypothetical protein